MVTPKTENGWGSVHNGGITGGAGGVEVLFSNFLDMWIWMASNLTNPAIVTYTGIDFSRLGLPTASPNSTFSNTSRFFISGLKNKTIRANAGQQLHLCNIQFKTNENIIWENWNHFDSLDDLIGIQTGSINIWIRHCALNGNQADAAFPDYTGTTDGAIDVTLESDFIAITDCIIRDTDKACLISRDATDTEDENKLRITYARNKFFQCVQRKPFGRFGRVGIQHNIFEYGNQFSQGASKANDPSFKAQFWAYQNKYIGENNAFLNRGDSTAGLKSALNRFINVTGNTSEINPSNVVWDILTEPNYTINTWLDAEMDEWVETWAGATMHLMEETPTTYTLTLTTTTGGAATRSPASGDIEQNATVILTASPSSGFNFSRWQNAITSQVLSTSATYNHVMTADISIVAVFVEEGVIPPPEGIRFCRIEDEPIF